MIPTEKSQVIPKPSKFLICKSNYDFFDHIALDVEIVQEVVHMPITQIDIKNHFLIHHNQPVPIAYNYGFSFDARENFILVKLPTGTLAIPVFKVLENSFLRNIQSVYKSSYSQVGTHETLGQLPIINLDTFAKNKTKPTHKVNGNLFEI